VLNLSGNNPHVVRAGADIENALDVACDGSFRYHGQTKISVNRHYVHESIRAEYVEGLVSRAEALTVGDPTYALTDVGPMVSDPQRETTSTYIEQSRDEGATVRTGGAHDGTILEPTVLSHVENGMPVVENETFGPVAPVLTFEDVDELYELVTSNPFGNVLSVHAETAERGRQIADAIDRRRIGTSLGRTDVHINPLPMSDDSEIDRTRAHFFDTYDEHVWTNRVTRSTWQRASEQ
jgi:aldehyde dehydrogenase (NAD+)